MSIIQKVKRFVRRPRQNNTQNMNSYNVYDNNDQNLFFNQWIPGSYQNVGENYNQNHSPQNDIGWNDRQPLQQNQIPGSYQNVGENYNQNHSPQNGIGWNDRQPLRQYQQFHQIDEKYYDDNFNSMQSFDGDQFSNKRSHDPYDGDFNPNKSKRQRLTETPSVQYAIKKSSQYPQPMRMVLDLLFKDEITADGWEKINDHFEYHTKIRGRTYPGSGGSIEDARENAAEKILKQIGGYKMELISWPQQLLPFRLEQPFADAIEMLVCLQLK